MAEDDDEGVDTSLVADVADETGFPRDLVVKLHGLWRGSKPPHFTRVVDGLLPQDGLRAIVRDLGVSDPLVHASVCRVIMDGGASASLDFARFMRGYAWLQSPTLQHALPFVFRVFDLDGDGKLSRTEFEQVLSAVLSMGDADASRIRALVEREFKEHFADELSYDDFAYFASLNTQSVYATCAFMPRVMHFSASAITRGAASTAGPSGRAAEGADERAAEAAAGAPSEADRDVLWFDADFAASLESLKSTASERAARWKDKGNAEFKQGKAHWPAAVEMYSSGLRERADEPALNAALLANRAAAHLSLKNFRHALNDCSACLELEPKHAKAARRGALCAHRLGELAQAERLCALALDLRGGQHGAPPAGEDDETRELQALAETIASALAARRAAEAAAEQRKRAEQEQREAILARRIELGPFLDEATEAQLLGPHSGARVWWDRDADEVHWPIALLYPQHQQMDFLQDVVESTALRDIVAEVLPADGPPAPWDAQREYTCPAVNIYLAPGRRELKPVLVPDHSRSLVEVLRMKGVVVPGVPMLYVLVRGSAFEREWRRQEELDDD